LRILIFKLPETCPAHYFTSYNNDQYSYLPCSVSAKVKPNPVGPLTTSTVIRLRPSVAAAPKRGGLAVV